MSSEAWIGIGGTLVACGVLSLAIWRGFTLDSLTFFGLTVKLPKPIAVDPKRHFIGIATILLLAGGASVAWGSYQKWFPAEWPTRYRDVETAELRLFDIDDFMTARVNGQPVVRGAYGNPTEWVDFKQHLHAGMNTIEITIQNGQYGGCGGSLEVSLNGLRRSDFRWTWFEQQAQPPNVTCFQRTQTIELR